MNEWVEMKMMKIALAWRGFDKYMADIELWN